MKARRHFTVLLLLSAGCCLFVCLLVGQRPSRALHAEDAVVPADREVAFAEERERSERAERERDAHRREAAEREEREHREHELHEQRERREREQRLAELIETAMDRNPNLRVARAHVEAAEAELHRARMETVQQVVTLFGSLQRVRMRVGQLREQAELHERRLHEREELKERGALSEQELGELRDRLREIHLNLVEQQGELEEIELRLRFVVGIEPDERHVRAEEEEKRPEADGEREIAERYDDLHQRNRETLKMLRARTRVEFVDTPLEDAIQFLSALHNVKIVIDKESLDWGKSGSKQKLNLSLKDVPFATALLAIEDTHSGLTFYVRDYGLLLTHAANQKNGMTVELFWRQFRYDE